MSGPGSELLKVLGSLQTPARDRAGGPAAGGAGSADFAAMLGKAKAGEISSGRAVTIGRGVDVRLSSEQLDRIAAAADRAESQGATSALVLIDGQALKLDVTMREVTGKADIAGGGVLTGVDAVVSVHSGGGKDAAATPLPGAGAGWGNASLLETLSKRPGAADGAA
jgi:hypothetical protein